MSTIDKALDNLDAIKNGTMETPLSIAVDEVDRLYEQYDLGETLEREKLHVGTARWERRNGVCKYNTRLGQKKEFGKRMTSLPRAPGQHVVVINERILDEGNTSGFLDTVRHEVAHAICYAEHGTSQKHNYNWKQMAAHLGADTSSCHNKKDTKYKYYTVCLECGQEYGKTRRSKVIKKPFTRKCGSCGHSPLSSHEAGEPRPGEDGVVAVDSIPWNNQEEYYNR